jgi:hypothetical protein
VKKEVEDDVQREEEGSHDALQAESKPSSVLTATPLLRPAYNPEIELSSDTEDSSSLAERSSERGETQDTTELLERLARCVASCNAEDQEEVRAQGERALRTLGVDLLASQEARSVLTLENQLLREKVVELEVQLKNTVSIHSKVGILTKYDVLT